MITRAGWVGCPIVEVTINTRYLPPGERVSHFQPWRDSLRSVGMHLRLIGRALLPLPNPIYHPHGKPLRQRVTWRDLMKWINPMRAWRELREGRIGRSEFAAAVSVGVFVANQPVYPFQTVFALYLARRLHLNPLAVLAGTQLSTPPINFVLIAGAIWIGHLLRHGAFAALPPVTNVQGLWELLARPMLLDWITGAPVVGFVLGGITFFVANHFYRGLEDEDDEGEPPVEPEVGVDLRKKAS